MTGNGDTRRRILILLFLAGAFGLSAAARGEDHPVPLPTSWGGTVAVGYDQNLLSSSRAEESAFGTESESYYFVIDRLNDWQGAIGLWARWDVPSFYRKMRIKMRYQRTEWAHNDILARDAYRIDLRQKLPGGSRFDLSWRYQPQVYLRHRVDKDAAPGDPRFRPESFRGTKIVLGYSRPLAGLLGTASAWFAEEDRNGWFNERDERALGAGLSVLVPVGDAATLAPFYGFDRSQSRNLPDVGSDRSYFEQIVKLRFRFTWSFAGNDWETALAARWKFRTYTTGDPDDSSRYNRHDQIYGWNLRLAHPGEPITPFIQIEAAGRLVDLPAGADASDEEGEYDDLLVRTGIDWQL